MNLHAESLFHCILASREDKGHSWIHDRLKEHYSDMDDFIGCGDKNDFGYVAVLKDKVMISVSGTIGPLFVSKAWRDNCRIIPENGIHIGWNEAWYECFAEKVRYITKRLSRPVKLTGVSRGGSVSQRGTLWLREEISHPDVEHVGYVQPVLTNRRGWKRMKKAKVRSTRWYNPGILRDPVDDVGVIGGKHYGLAMKLPDPPNDILIMDHDYINICDAMSIQFNWWGMPVESQFCQDIKRFCKRI